MFLTSNTLTKLWCRLYNNIDPSSSDMDLTEVLWEADAINAWLKTAFPGSVEWYVRPSTLNIAMAVGKTAYGTYEVIVEDRHSTIVGYVYATISPWPTLTPKTTTPEKPLHPNYEDKVTRGLMRDALKTHGKDVCPKCRNQDLHFYRTVLRCSRCLTHVGGC